MSLATLHIPWDWWPPRGDLARRITVADLSLGSKTTVLGFHNLKSSSLLGTSHRYNTHNLKWYACMSYGAQSQLSSPSHSMSSRRRSLALVMQGLHIAAHGNKELALVTSYLHWDASCRGVHGKRGHYFSQFFCGCGTRIVSPDSCVCLNDYCNVSAFSTRVVSQSFLFRHRTEERISLLIRDEKENMVQQCENQARKKADCLNCV